MTDGIGRREILTMAGATAAIGAVATRFPTRSAAATTHYSGTLRSLAGRKGLLCGSAVGAEALAADAKLRAVLSEDANILVPENELKWSRIQPTRNGALDFAPAEAIYAYAKANDMAMRGHTLTWYRGEPDWAKALIPTLTPGQAGDMLTRYVHDVVSHWRGRLVQWDVVNEPVAAKGQLLETLWSGKLGEQYIDLAFEAAHAADPKALLMANHALIEQQWWYEEAQAAQTLRLLERLLKRGVPIQGFGVEGHLQTQYDFSEARWRSFLDELTGMGLKIVVTEFDVNDAGTMGDIARRDAASVALATAFLDTTLSYRNCLGLLTWGASDRYSWLRIEATKQRADRAPQRPDLRDDNFQRKPLWQAVAGAIARAPAR